MGELSEVCKTFIHRFDSDRRLQIPSSALATNHQTKQNHCLKDLYRDGFAPRSFVQ